MGKTVTNDLPPRLREIAGDSQLPDADIYRQAADEIEALRSRLKLALAKLEEAGIGGDID